MSCKTYSAEESQGKTQDMGIWKSIPDSSELITNHTQSSHKHAALLRDRSTSFVTINSFAMPHDTFDRWVETD